MVTKAPFFTVFSMDDEAEVESDPVQVISDDSGSVTGDIDIKHWLP